MECEDVHANDEDKHDITVVYVYCVCIYTYIYILYIHICIIYIDACKPDITVVYV